jgi:hypothetical protein
VWNGQEIKFGIFVLSVILVVIITGLTVVIVLRLAQSTQSHDDHFIFRSSLSRYLSSLSTADYPCGVRVGGSIFTEVIA